jgi:hypothetical protein
LDDGRAETQPPAVVVLNRGRQLMKRKHLILVFVVVALVMAFTFVFQVGAMRYSERPTQRLALSLNRGVVSFGAYRIYEPVNPSPSPALWQGGFTGARSNALLNRWHGGFYFFKWSVRSVAGSLNNGIQISVPLWPALLILAAMIFMERRRVNRGAFPVGAPTT